MLLEAGRKLVEYAEYTLKWQRELEYAWVLEQDTLGEYPYAVIFDYFWANHYPLLSFDFLIYKIKIK